MTEKTEACNSNNPAKRRVMRSKCQKQSALKLVDRIILHKHGFNAPQLALGFHARDWMLAEIN